MARAEPQDRLDELLARLRLLGEDDDAVAAFLDTLDLRGARERELLAELASRRPLARPDVFPEASRVLVRALESLGRHGYHSAETGHIGWLRVPVRFLVELVARYLVVSYLRRVATDVRNLYWLREMQSASGSAERAALRRARRDAEGLVTVFQRRTIGVPSFLLGGILVSVSTTVARLASGVATSSWRPAAAIGLAGVLLALAAAWVTLRGAAMASRRIRLSVREPLAAVWAAVGHCGRPPRDQSRKLALVGIALTFAAWAALPLAVAVSFVA